MGDFISVQCSEWACSCTKCLSGVKLCLGYKDELVRYLQKHSHTTLLLNQSKSNRLMLKRDSHNLNTNRRCSTWQGWSIGNHKQIVCSKWLVPSSWVWSMEVMSTYLKNPTTEKALWHHHSIMNKFPKQFVGPSL